MRDEENGSDWTDNLPIASEDDEEEFEIDQPMEDWFNGVWDSYTKWAD